MSEATWADAANRTLALTFRWLPPDASREQVNAAVYEAYPFGDRAYHPYKVWLHCARRWKANQYPHLFAPPKAMATRRVQYRDVPTVQATLFGGAA
jgi:hypothetical protein